MHAKLDRAFRFYQAATAFKEALSQFLCAACQGVIRVNSHMYSEQSEQNKAQSACAKTVNKGMSPSVPEIDIYIYKITVWGIFFRGCACGVVYVPCIYLHAR